MVKRTTKQRNNIKKGCANGNKDAIIIAQKKRHLKARINKLIIQAIKKQTNMANWEEWINKVETITDTIALNELQNEIEREINQEEQFELCTGLK